MKKTKEITDKKTFPVKGVTVDTFDKKLNGLNEHSLKFLHVLPLVLNDPKEHYTDLLRRFAHYLIDQRLIDVDERAVFLHIKTNTYKKVSISCLVKLPKKKKEKQDGTLKRATTRKTKVGNSALEAV